MVRKTKVPNFGKNELETVVSLVNGLVKKQDHIDADDYDTIPLMQVIMDTCTDIKLGSDEDDLKVFKGRPQAIVNQIFNHFGEEMPFPTKKKKVVEEEEEEEEEENVVKIVKAPVRKKKKVVVEEEEEEEEEEEVVVKAIKKTSVKAPARTVKPKKVVKLLDTDDVEVRNLINLFAAVMGESVTEVSLKLIAESIKEKEDESNSPVITKKVVKTPKTVAKKTTKKKAVPRNTDVQGVQDMIIDYVYEYSTRKKTIPTDEILDMLEENFPEKKRSSMKTTVNAVLGYKIKNDIVKRYKNEDLEIIDIDFEVIKHKNGGWYTK